MTAVFALSWTLRLSLTLFSGAQMALIFDQVMRAAVSAVSNAQGDSSAKVFQAVMFNSEQYAGLADPMALETATNAAAQAPLTPSIALQIVNTAAKAGASKLIQSRGQGAESGIGSESIAQAANLIINALAGR
jgi:hypothetical protein